MRKVIAILFLLFFAAAFSYADRSFTVRGDKDLPVEFTLSVDAVGSFDIGFVDKEGNDVYIMPLSVDESLMMAGNDERSLYLKCNIISSSSYTVLMSIKPLASQSGSSVNELKWKLNIDDKNISSEDTAAAEVVKHISGATTAEKLPIKITVPLVAGASGLYTGSISVTMRLDGEA